VCTFCCSTPFFVVGIYVELNLGLTPFIQCHNCGQRVSIRVKKCSCGQNMRKRSKPFVKSCDFVQTVSTTPQYYSNHHGSHPVGTPQRVGIKGHPPHTVLVLKASLLQPRHKVLNKVSYASFLLNRFGTGGCTQKYRSSYVL